MPREEAGGAEQFLTGLRDAAHWQTSWDSAMRRLAAPLARYVAAADTFERAYQNQRGATPTAEAFEYLDRVQDEFLAAKATLDTAAEAELDSGRL